MVCNNPVIIRDYEDLNRVLERLQASVSFSRTEWEFVGISYVTFYIRKLENELLDERNLKKPTDEALQSRSQIHPDMVSVIRDNWGAIKCHH